LLTPLTTPPDLLPASAERARVYYYSLPDLQISPIDGQPLVLYYKTPENDVWFAERKNGAWAYERLSSGSFSPSASIALDPAGSPHALLHDAPRGAILGSHESGSWTFEPAPGVGRLRFDFQGRPHVAFAGGSNLDEIQHAEPDAGGWGVVACDTAHAFARTFSLAVDGNGEPHLAYYSRMNESIRYAKRSGGIWTVETVATGLDIWGATAIAVGSGGEPFIVYSNWTGEGIWFARRVQGVWQRQLLGSTADAQQSPSLAIDANGRPHVAYFGMFQLRYAVGSPVTSVDARRSIAGFRVGPVAPNPVRSGGTLQMSLELEGHRQVFIELLDVTGRRVAVREPEDFGPGSHLVQWSPRVPAGGLYFLRVASDRGEQETLRVARIP